MPKYISIQQDINQVIEGQTILKLVGKEVKDERGKGKVREAWGKVKEW